MPQARITCENGFTLLEVVVALAVVSIIATTALTTVSGSLEADRHAEATRRSVKIARREFDSWTPGNPESPSGADGDVSWTIETRPLSRPAHPGAIAVPFELVFTARSGDGELLSEFRAVRFGPIAAER
ncbi:MAG: prepilin-type N-terminal cleavage/methylation domain-containing protein [Pseudomonadota bacterium]